jgi:catechol 2,3-dioxygenase-like lactoylglutathione lyase family enzyme
MEGRQVAVTGIGFVGIRSDKLEEMTTLFRDVIGVPTSKEESDVTAFRLSNGTLLELFGPKDDFHAFFTTGPVVGFQVDSFVATRARMVAAGIRFIGEPQHEDGVSWQHFHCPDGTVAEIVGPD